MSYFYDEKQWGEGETDHYADAFVGKNIAYSYDVVTTL